MSKTFRDTAIIFAVTFISTVGLWLSLGFKTIYENFDGPYYGVVAKTWYNKELIAKTFSFPLPLEYYAAHLPGYPLLMSVASVVTGNLMSGGLIITFISTLFGVGIIYLIWKNMRWGDPLWAAIAWLFVWPRMWAVRSIVSPEPLFIGLVLLSLWAFDKKRYFWSGVAGALAVVTKSPGLLLFAGYGLWWLEQTIRTKKLNLQIWPVILIPTAFIGVCFLYQYLTGDFWAYFHSGDNLHIQSLPFEIFNSNQVWVGSVWLEDILWIYLIGGIGVYLAYKKNKVWGWFGIVFLTAIAFVSHRDISRYSLPVVPVVILGFSEIMKRKEFKIAFLIWLVPICLFTVNFLSHNTVDIASFAPFIWSSK